MSSTATVTTGTMARPPRPEMSPTMARPRSAGNAADKASSYGSQYSPSAEETEAGAAERT